MQRTAFLLTLLLTTATSLVAGPGSGRARTARMAVGRLPTGAAVSLVSHAAGEWGLDIAGGAAPGILQAKPARLEVFRAEGDIRPLATAYGSVRKSGRGVEARADVVYGDDVVFHVVDQWSLVGAVLSLRRTVTVTGRAPGGYSSGIVFAIEPSVGWPDVQYLAPGALYGDPTYDGERSPGGTLDRRGPTGS